MGFYIIKLGPSQDVNFDRASCTYEFVNLSEECMQGAEFEAKVAKLVELGFGREQVVQALKLFDGNEEQAAGFLFG